MHQKWGMASNVGDMTKHPPRSVLVVEDDDSLLTLFMQVLKRAGYDARSAGTEAHANSLLAQKTFDVVVIDLSVSGNHYIFEFVASIRTRYPEIIVLIISGYTPEEVMKQAAGVHVEVMEKPFAPDELVRRIRSLLAARAA
jgi:DNA-binding NtrC family response regulator